MSDEEHGLRPIGSLTSKIANMQSSEGSTQAKSPKASETSGMPKPGSEPANATGEQRGALGAGMKLPAILSGSMAGSKPEETDEALQGSLKRLFGQPLGCVERHFVDPVYGYDFELTGYRLPVAISDNMLTAARSLVAATLRPATEPMIIQELARLKLTTKSRQGDATDYEMAFVILAEELREFPPDVIRSALRKVARRETFFPSLAEMVDQCQREFRNRKMIAKAVGLED